MTIASTMCLRFLLISTLFFTVFQSRAQDNTEYRIIRSNLGSSGSSHAIPTDNGTYKISQSIGQSSVIGTHYNNGFYLRQGYQQPHYKIKLTEDFNYELQAFVYPNPFENTITIAFNEILLNTIQVVIYDVNSKLIYKQEFRPAQEIELQIDDASSGNYFLKVSSKNKYFITKLIKI